MKKMLTKNSYEQKIRRTDIYPHSIASNIFNNFKLLYEYFISNQQTKLNWKMAIPLSASKSEVSLS